MTDNQRIEFEALIAVREGMNAENQRREGANESPAFGADDFDAIAEKMRTLKGPEEEVRDTPPPEPEEWEIPEIEVLRDQDYPESSCLYFGSRKIGICSNPDDAADIAHVFGIAREAVEWIEKHQDAFGKGGSMLDIERDNFLALAKKGPKP